MPKPLAVLIVEDNNSDAQLIVRLLTKAGYSLTFEQVETAAQMRAALEKQAWEMVISDFSMPELDGHAALKLMQETGLDIPFIVASGTMGEETAVGMMKAGAHDYVMKGNLARLVPAVERELEQAEVRRERKRAEEALRESELQHRTILRTAMDGFWLVDLQGRLLEVNDTYCRMSGYSEQELLGMRIPDLESQEVDSDTASHIQKIIAEGEDRFESRHRRKNGSVFNVEISVQYRAEEGGGFVAFLQDITERKRVEEALQLSEKNYRALFDNLPIGIYRTSADGRLLDVNPALVKMFDYPDADSMLTLNAMDIYAQPAHVAAFNSAAYPTAVVSGFEAEFRRRDGTIFWAEDNVRILRDPAGRILSFEGGLTDISERKQMEERLQESQNLLYEVVENSGVSMYSKDRQGRYKLVNKKWENGNGIPRELAIGKTDLELFPGKIGEEYRNHDLLVMELDSRVETEETNKGREGMKYYISVKIPLRDINNVINGVCGISTEITARKQAEILQDAIYRIAQAADRTRSLDSLYPSIHAIIQEVMVADNFYIALYDENHDMLTFPYSVDTVDALVAPQKPGKGLTAYVLRTAKSLLCDESLFEELIQRGEAELIGVASSIWLGVPLLIEGKAIGVVAVQDYTNARAYGEREQRILEYVSSQAAIAIDRKRSEDELMEYSEHLEEMVSERTRELTEAQEKLVRSERLAVLGQISGSVSHELRNPLGVISNAIYFLKLVQPEANDKVRKYHAMIENEVHTADKIIADLLDFARIKSANREQVSVAQVVSHTLERFPVPASVEVTLDLPADLPLVFADPRQVEQVLGNLVMNAWQAMATSTATGVEAGGKLSVISNQCSANGEQWVRIHVKDTGTGILPENRKKIFEPLFSTKVTGIGLGLAISKSLAEANDGWIEVESEPGKGSTFTLYLPVHPEGGSSQ